MSSVHCIRKYDKFIEASHSESPILIQGINAEIFRVVHGIDLNEEFNTDSHGLSKIACMCPTCPFFKKKFTGPVDEDGFQLHLFEHYPKLQNKTLFRQPTEQNYLLFEAHFI